jgi:oxygen-dependent protoporphyrinogen oxidase
MIREPLNWRMASSRWPVSSGTDQIATLIARFPPVDHDRATVCDGDSVRDLPSVTPRTLADSASRTAVGAGDQRPHVVVVGAGISGLVAARALLLDGRVRVTVLEGSPRTGGKLLRGQVAGIETDLGAEAVLARRPEGLALIESLGFDSIPPNTTQAAIWSRGRLRPLPSGHVMGVPVTVRSLLASRVVSRVGVARAALDVTLPATAIGEDVSVASYVGARLGHEVVDRLVEPLLGGVYAGQADELSLRATLPQVAAVADQRSLLHALRSRPAQPPAGPVFAGLAGGVGQLTEALTASLTASGADVVLDATVRELARMPAGWRLVTGSAASPKSIDADAVVLALPATPAGRLLAASEPLAARDLAAIDYASMAIVTLAFSASAFKKPLSGSGFLVPAVDGRLIKAATFSTRKWGWYDESDAVLVRCSVGRHGDAGDLQRSDDELVAGAVRDLAAAVGVRGVPRDAVVTRWGGALPQYSVGHLDRVARIKAALATVPGLVACGAAFDGVGIPACIGSGSAAATQLLSKLFGEGE